MERKPPQTRKPTAGIPNNKKLVFLGAFVLFSILNCIAIVRELPVIPLITGACVIVWLMIFRIDLLIGLMALATPFSVSFSLHDYNLGLSMPAEIIMIALTLLFVFRVLYDIRLDREILTHPISIAVCIYLLWMLVTCITSTMPLVSFKFLASKVWFTTACYWVVVHYIRSDLSRATGYFGCYAFSLAIVVLVTLVKHSSSGFGLQHGNWVMDPFYRDHTVYGAAIAFFLPITAVSCFLPGNGVLRKVFYAAVTVILCVGLYFSYCRAAWLSVAVAAAVCIVMKLHIRPLWIAAAAVLAGSILYFHADDILYRMSRNSQDSSGNIVEHLQSISNITTDASNVERLNRWSAAYSMAKERPLTGWGPGTYQFKYAAFQQSRYRTVISTDFGNLGNAHSEYLGPLAETGIPGLLTVLGLLFCSLTAGTRAYFRSRDKTERLLAFMMTLALVTYFVHGALNNYLDTDKLSLPFWGAFAVIMLTDMKTREDRKNESDETPC